MGTVPTAASLRSLLAALTTEDWERARQVAPALEDSLRRASKMHRSQPVFSSNGKLTAPITAKLGRMSIQRLALAIAPLLLALESPVDDAAPPGNADVCRESTTPEKPVSPQLAALAQYCGVLPLPLSGGLERNPRKQLELESTPKASTSSRLPTGTAGHQSGPAIAASGSGVSTAATSGEAASMQALAVQLQETQAAVLIAIEGIHARVEEGKPPDPGDLAQLEGWQSKLIHAADLLGILAGEVSILKLNEAADAAARAAEADRESAELRSILDEISGASYGSEKGRRLETVAEQIRNADPATLPEQAKEAFRALHRLMRAPGYDADPQDAERVQAAFGLPVVLAAAGALLTADGEAGEQKPQQSPSPAVEPPHKSARPSAPAQDVPSGSAPVATLTSPPEKREAGWTAPPSDAAELIESAPDAVIPAAADQGSRTPPAPMVEDLESRAPDPRIVAAVRADRPGLAYWYSVALGLPKPIQAAFDVLALSAAITTDGDDCSMRIRALLQDFDLTAVAYQQDYLKVLAAGSARALLRMPFSCCAAVLQEATTLIESSSAAAFLGAVQHAATFGLELGRFRDAHGGSLPELIAHRDGARSELSSTMDSLSQLRTRYARATSVWRRLVSDRGPLGDAVSCVLADPDDLTSAEELLGHVRDLKSIDKLIDDWDRQLHPIAARRSKIIAGARDDLREHTQDLLRALREYVEAARALTARQRTDTPDQLAETVERLTQAVSANGDNSPEPDVGSLALAGVKHWLRDVLVDDVPLPSAELPASLVLARDLSCCFEVRRLNDGTVEAASVTVESLDALDGRSAEQAYEGFVANDDHAGAEQLIDALRAEGELELASRLSDRQQEDRSISRERLRGMLARTERELARALSAALLSESESAAQQAELDRLRDVDVTDFPAAKVRLREIQDGVAAARERAITQARRQLAGLGCPEPVRKRIERQLDDGDLVNAQEFLAQMAMGAPGLPAEAEADETLTEFWPEFAAAVDAGGAAGQTEQPYPAWLQNAADAHGTLAGRTLLPPEASRFIEEGWRGWVNLARFRRGHGHDWQESLKAVLQLLGLETKKGPFDPGQFGSRRWWVKFDAVPVGDSLVPAYGSNCRGHYQLLLCWDKMSPDVLLDLVSDRPAHPPVIVLYFRTFTKQERRALAERSRPQHKNVTAIVVDNAVTAFLATRPDTRLRTTMAVTLPFTAVNPYTPFVLGDVPREVFYGRKEELRRVQDANDALFVYGGRQLGKSALLKTARREFAQTDPRWRSVYVDLKAEGIGDYREPDDIWPVLVPHLQAVGVLDSKVSPKAGPDVVVTQIRRWLETDQERRLLLLLDEADAFLETDARARMGLVGEARFANVSRLKGLMDGSARRFKPVFAGLHQVQRSHKASNGPMAHVGAEILVGPLPPAEAFKLVVRPLSAIGNRLESPDVAWRLLAYTNYQASLIQIFCDALVRRLHRRALAAEAPPTVITDRDIDEVYGDKEVRDQIAERFELTINLDNRYRVIAYTTAWLTLNSDDQTFATITLYDDCKTFWPAGFAEQTLDDFSSYLDEMVGLGVLVRTSAGEYGIRSPNVIRLLGTKEEIERRLGESDRLELSRPYDPAVFRRALGADPDHRSPLTEQQVQQILDGGTSIQVVVGSTALGLERVATALCEAAPEGTEVREATCASAAEVMTTLSRGKSGPRHVVLNLDAAGHDERLRALQILQRQVRADPRLTASCLAPREASWIWRGDIPDLSLELVRIKPWTDDTLRAWAPECEYPLTTTQQRARLLDATGGWPDLVEAAARSARGGASEARACQEAIAPFSEASGVGHFLQALGLSADPVADEVAEVASTWSDEITFDDLATLVDAGRNAVLAAVTTLVNLAVLNRASSEDAYRINPLVARLLHAG